MVAHLGTYPVKAPGFLAAFGGNDAAGPESLADVGVVEFAVELRIGQHEADRTNGVGGIHEGAKVRSVVGRAGVSLLREHKLSVEIDGDQPLQPMTPGPRLLVVVVHASHQEGAEGTRTQAGGINGHLGAALAPGGAMR